MTPVRSVSTPTVREVDRRFVDDLNHVRTAAGRTAAASAARSATASPGSAASAADGTSSAAIATASGGAATAARAPLSRPATTTGATENDAAPERKPIGSGPAGPGTGSGAIPRDEEGNIVSRGSLSQDPHTKGMYVPPDFYHGTSYSPVFDRLDENGNWIATPRFDGQKIYSKWRGSLPPDFDPNARVIHDPLLDKQGPRWWKQDENGDWVRRPEGPGGVALLDDGTPIVTIDEESTTS